MSSNEKNANEHATIIVRRKGGHEDGHHGGAWKIAYADFMTAMMAFFLVMWLVNSADQQKIVQIAAYFNPIRLSEKQPSERGLHDGTIAAHGTRDNANAAKSRDKTKSTDATDAADESPEKESRLEQRRNAIGETTLFLEPQDTLSKIVARAMATDTATPTADAAGSRTNALSIDDPFDTQRKPPPSHTVPSRASAPDAPTVKTPDAVKAEAVAALARDVEQALARVAGPKPDIDVRRTEDGILISLADDADFDMFASGSAEPTPPAIAIIERIAAVVGARAEPIVVRGHTDSRPYRRAGYDNWRLSSARAQMSYYMLIRGGVTEARFARVEGHADKMPRVASDTRAPQNRRIDILLVDKPRT